jgi:hypothetical protein
MVLRKDEVEIGNFSVDVPPVNQLDLGRSWRYGFCDLLGAVESPAGRVLIMQILPSLFDCSEVVESVLKFD